MANPQSWNRYSYVVNNPLRYTDPTGHKCKPDDGCETPHGDKGGTGTCNIWISNCGWGLGSGGNGGGSGGDCLTCSTNKDKENGGHRGSFFHGDGVVYNPVILPGPTPTTNNGPSNDPLFEIKFWLEAYDWLQYVDGALTFTINYGRPIYRHAKGLVPGFFWLEALLGFVTQGLSDLGDPNLTWRQRLGRAVIVGLEDGVSDIVSTWAARLAAPWGAKAGGVIAAALAAPETAGYGSIPAGVVGSAIGGGVTYFGVSYGVTRLMDDRVWAPLNRRYVPGLFPPNGE